MSKFLDSEILNYTIKNLVSQIDKTFLKKNVLFNVTPAYYRLFNSVTDNPSDKLTVIANGLTPTTGQVTSDTVRFQAGSGVVAYRPPHIPRTWFPLSGAIPCRRQRSGRYGLSDIPEPPIHSAP